MMRKIENAKENGIDRVVVAMVMGVVDMGADVGMAMVITIGMAMMVRTMTSSIILPRKTASSRRS